MINFKKEKLIKKHLGVATPDWIVQNCIKMLNEFEDVALTIPVVVDMLPKKNSKDFKDWLIDGGYTKTRTKDVYMKGDSGFTTDVLYRHFCNVITFGN